MDYANMLRGNGFLSVNKVMLRVLGTNKAVFLAHLFDLQSYRKSQKDLTMDGAFYIRAADWRTNTGQSPYTLNKSIQWAESLGLLQTDMRGIPAKRFFKVVDDKMGLFLNELFSTETVPEALPDEEPALPVEEPAPAETVQVPTTEGLLGIFTPTIKPVSET